MPLAFALAGCGVMGRRHVLGMQKLQAAGLLPFDLAAVCDVMPEPGVRAAVLAEEVLGRRPQVFSSLDEMLRSANLDGLIVTTTPESHPGLVLAAFDAGLDVMVEKPISLGVPEGLQLVQAGRAAGRILAVAENYRRDPINRLARALLDAGAIGRPFLATQATSGSGGHVIMAPWRHRNDRGGILLDMGVHYADILEYLLGSIDTVAGMSARVDAERVDAAGHWHAADAEDLSAGVLRFRSGAIGHWLLNMAGRGEAHYSRMVYGLAGSLSIPPDRSGKPLALVVRKGNIDEAVPPEALLNLVPDFALDPVSAALFGGERLASYDLPWADTDANLLALEQEDFAQAVISRRDPEVTGEQGLRSVAVVSALLEAQRAGRQVALDEMLGHGFGRAHTESLETSQ